MSRDTENLYVHSMELVENKNCSYNNGIITFQAEQQKRSRDCYGMILVYAPWCPHCKNMVEEWVYLEKQLSDPFKIILNAVNAENIDNEQFIQSLNVSGFPTLYTINKDIFYCHG